jgi:hypothetical protein
MKLLLATLLLYTTIANGQDSLQTTIKTKTPFLNHEIGFNAIQLIKQVISNNPSATLPQLPYSLFYNIYYKNTLGVRLGAGIAQNSFETAIFGQVDGRKTTLQSTDIRAGISYNFIKSKRITANVFADFITTNQKEKTTSTSEIQTFPNPKTKLSVTNTDVTKGSGGQLGVGLKCNITKHLSIYTEVPIMYMQLETKNNLDVDDDGTFTNTNATKKETDFKIILPTTIYLVLNF